MSEQDIYALIDLIKQRQDTISDAIEFQNNRLSGLEAAIKDIADRIQGPGHGPPTSAEAEMLRAATERLMAGEVKK